MEFPSHFICAGTDFNTQEKAVPAPYLRRSFAVEDVQKANLTITALGCYELFVNGQKITRSINAPYRSNPDDLIYYDTYDLRKYLTNGENVLGVILGNGFVNNVGGSIWEFDKAPFRSAPMLALALELEDTNGSRMIESDEQFVCKNSPILMDDSHMGEYYDANQEIPGWNLPGFNAQGWAAAKAVLNPPRGEKRLCEAIPIRTVNRLEPVAIEPDGDTEEDGWRYDFGIDTTGVVTLNINGTPGQQLELRFAETLKDGHLFLDNIQFGQGQPFQTVRYTCKGGKESYTPTFPYFGFRYVRVRGITKAQATKDLLTLLEQHADLPTRGGFNCSDETINALQECTRRSDRTNFWFFPTDCPHREKNGWTADAALSAEQLLLNYEPDASYIEWMRNICKAMKDNGSLPGIVPTGGWGFDWGNGPAWDSVLAWLPHALWKYRGDLTAAKECAPAFLRYLNYLDSRIRSDGLIAIGLGDWCQPGHSEGDYQAPLEVTDTIMSIDIAQKIAEMLTALDLPLQAAFARNFASKLHTAAVRELVDPVTCLVRGNVQTCQVLGIVYGLFTKEQEEKAFAELLAMIEENNGHLNAGVIGARQLFHLLADRGQAELAFDMIARPDYPSFGNWIKRGATTLWEAFWKDGDRPLSCNHHFWGDISSWFYQVLAGLRFNPQNTDIHRVDIKPEFVHQLEDAAAWYLAPDGRIESGWKRTENGVTLTVTVPDGMHGTIFAPAGWQFADGSCQKPLSGGSFALHQA